MSCFGLGFLFMSIMCLELTQTLGLRTTACADYFYQGMRVSHTREP